MITYNEIKNDPYIIEMYNTIDEISINTLWSAHGWSHILNVVNTVETIMKKLSYDEDIIECAKIAALLHDIGCIKGKENHAVESYNIVSKYLSNKDISDEYREKILTAILNHGGSKSVTSIIDAVLVFADKVHYDKTRLLPLGYEVENFNQIQYVDKINVLLSDTSLTVQFIVSDMFDKSSMEKFYFIPKIFKAVYNFSEYLNVKPCIKLNDNEWILA